jgi:hypothetical protein
MGKDWRYSDDCETGNGSKFNRRAERLAREFSRDVSFRDSDVSLKNDTQHNVTWSRGARSIRKLGVC